MNGTGGPTYLAAVMMVGCRHASILLANKQDVEFYGGTIGEIVYRWLVCGSETVCRCDAERRLQITAVGTGPTGGPTCIECGYMDGHFEWCPRMRGCLMGVTGIGVALPPPISGWHGPFQYVPCGMAWNPFDKNTVWYSKK